MTEDDTPIQGLNDAIEAFRKLTTDIAILSQIEQSLSDIKYPQMQVIKMALQHRNLALAEGISPESAEKMMLDYHSFVFQRERERDSTRTMTEIDIAARESSLFYVLGLADKLTLTQIAYLYRVPVETLITWLEDMGFSQNIISVLSNGHDFEDGFCYRCGIRCSSVFCSDDCYQQEQDNLRELLEIHESGEIPLTFLRNTVYSITNERMERKYDYR